MFLTSVVPLQSISYWILYTSIKLHFLCKTLILSKLLAPTPGCFSLACFKCHLKDSVNSKSFTWFYFSIVLMTRATQHHHSLFLSL